MALNKYDVDLVLTITEDGRWVEAVTVESLINMMDLAVRTALTDTLAGAVDPVLAEGFIKGLTLVVMATTGEGVTL